MSLIIFYFVLTNVVCLNIGILIKIIVFYFIRAPAIVMSSTHIAPSVCTLSIMDILDVTWS